MAQSLIPTTIVTGFLGAGKTTLIARLLRECEDCRLALIVNEFGEVGIDADTLRGCGLDACGGEGGIVELANGCLCCTVADEFIPAMSQLLAREPPPDHIVIETSGLAMPQPLVRAFRWPEIRNHIVVDAVVTVVDGPAVAAGTHAPDPEAVDRQRKADPALDHERALRALLHDQLIAADLVVIGKTDGMQETAIIRAEQEVSARVRPGTRMIRSTRFGLPPELLLGRNLHRNPGAKQTGAARSSAVVHSIPLEIRDEDEPGSNPDHEHHDHGHDDHDAFASFSWQPAEIADLPTLRGNLERTMVTFKLLRLKGTVAIRGKPLRLGVQAVGGRVELNYTEPWESCHERRGNLVAIGGCALTAGDHRRAIIDAIEGNAKGQTECT